MPDFDFFGGETVHYPLSNGVDEVSEQFFFAQTGFSTVWAALIQISQHLVVGVTLESKCGRLLVPFTYGRA